MAAAAVVFLSLLAVPDAMGAATTLYDAGLGTLPDAQGWFYYADADVSRRFRRHGCRDISGQLRHCR